MPSTQKKNSLLCPGCRKLVSRSAPTCPYCGIKRPGSLLKDNIFTRGLGSGEAILKYLLYCNIAMFVLSLLIDMQPTSFSSSPFTFLSPSNRSLLVLGSSGSIPIFQLDRWWSLISASYLHGGLMHIAFNMIALHQLGPLVVREYGSKRMFAIYTLAGAAGYMLSALVGIRFTIGASAAVCGLIGALLFYGQHRGGSYGKAVFSQIGSWAIGIMIFGFVVPGINNWGHGGGIAAGYLLGALLGYRDRGTDKMGHRLLGAGCMVFTGLILAWSVVNGLLFLTG